MPLHRTSSTAVVRSPAMHVPAVAVLYILAKTERFPPMNQLSWWKASSEFNECTQESFDQIKIRVRFQNGGGIRHKKKKDNSVAVYINCDFQWNSSENL